MVAAGGKHRVRAWATLIALVFSAGLAGCEVADDVGVPGPDTAPTARPPAPRPTLPPPTQDEAVAAEAAKNTAVVQRLLGPRPKNEVMAALTGIGFRQTKQGTVKGLYAVSVACAGTPTALVTVTQPDRRYGTRLTLKVPCGRTVEASVKLESGPTTVQVDPLSTEPAPGAAVAIRLERLPTP
ncbi:hypothetical protein [Arthrobacter sp. Soil763]|uniref:hypothetical protein n=1 Tax=Arthrobacter sp. Soil763 TaxID=1736402 RepID=UPI0006F825D8|nr:hypothetical protein [Arthrobacter sp. Soil763]KRE79437.1 hypothetical protein ASG71_04990 [Arthrobacter sp. Soil763]